MVGWRVAGDAQARGDARAAVLCTGGSESGMVSLANSRRARCSPRAMCPLASGGAGRCWVWGQPAWGPGGRAWGLWGALESAAVHGSGSDSAAVGRGRGKVGVVGRLASRRAPGSGALRTSFPPTIVCRCWGMPGCCWASKIVKLTHRGGTAPCTRRQHRAPPPPAHRPPPAAPSVSSLRRPTPTTTTWSSRPPPDGQLRRPLLARPVRSTCIRTT